MRRLEERGIALIELMVALALTIIVIFAIYKVYLFQHKSYTVENQVAEMQQNARTAIDVMVREIRMAGFGVPTSNLSSWVDWVTGITINDTIQIVQGSGSDPDTIYIVGCFDPPPASLSTSASSGDTSLTLKDETQASKFNTDKKKLISIDGLENAIITNIYSNTLTIDTDPTTDGNQGLTRSYDADTPIYLVKVITYSIVSDTLKRNENTGGGAQPLAENIEDLQISKSNDFINISLTARTARPDPDYPENNGYRKRTFTTRVKIRNE